MVGLFKAVLGVEPEGFAGPVGKSAPDGTDCTLKRITDLNMCSIAVDTESLPKAVLAF